MHFFILWMLSLYKLTDTILDFNNNNNLEGPHRAIIQGGCHVPARPYVPASLDHLRVEGHDLRDAQGRTGT